jgi:hypothetical protein
MELYTGMDFFGDSLGIPESTFKVAMSFYSGSFPYIDKDFWATDSCSGLAIGASELAWNNGFFSSGRVLFDGDSLISFKNTNEDNKKLFLSDSAIFMSFERMRNDNEILISSIDSNNNVFSGFCLGINDANKLYFKYWNSVEGAFTFTFSPFLSKKNLIFLSREESTISIGRFNNNSLLFEVENFPIYKNNLVESNDLVLGGYYTDNNPSFLDKNRAPWAFDNAKNFSGAVDKYYHISNFSSIYKDAIVSGFFAKPTAAEGYSETYCYETGFFEPSGSFVLAKTGVFVSGYSSGVEVITGYYTFESGYTYYGLIGYEDTVVGEYEDQCKVTHPIIETNPVSGFITDYKLVKLPLFDVIYKTGAVEIDLSGLVYQEEMIPVTETICDDRFFPTGDVKYSYDTGYLSSLSYNKFYFTGNDESFPWIVDSELYIKPFALENYKYNLLAQSSDVAEDYWVPEDYSDKRYFEFFNDGKNLIESGFTLQFEGYEERVVPTENYFLSGNSLYTGLGVKKDQNIIYDYQESPNDQIDIYNYNYVFTPELRERIFTGKNFDRAFFFRNGIKLRGEDFFIPQYSVIQWPNSGQETSVIDIKALGLNPPYPDWGNIAYGNDVFACIPLSADISTIVTSYDGIDWRGISGFPGGIGDARFRALNFVKDRFVIFKGLAVRYSFDAINWLTGSFTSFVPNLGDFNWSQIAYGKNKFISFSRSFLDNYGVVSYDGISWSPLTRPNTIKYINKINYIGDDTNGRFLGVCGEDALNERTSAFIYSEDGINWSTSIMPQQAAWIDFAFGNSRLISIGKDSNFGKAAISYNSGETWSSASLPGESWNSITYENGMFLLLSNNSGAYSYDGIYWNAFKLTNITPNQSPAPISSQEYKYVAYGKEKFVSLYKYYNDMYPLQLNPRTGIYFEVYDSFSLFNSFYNTKTSFSYKDYGELYALPFGEFSYEGPSNNTALQAYFNGRRQELGKDYFEVSNFDLLSGYLDSPSEKNIIYNIEDGFLESL